jgi:hypothetical protein
MIAVWSQSRQIVWETLSWKTLSQKTGLVKWLKVKALSSSPSTTKKRAQVWLCHFLAHKLLLASHCLWKKAGIPAQLTVLFMSWSLH